MNKRTFHVQCRICELFFRAYSPNAKYCHECRFQVRICPVCKQSFSIIIGKSSFEKNLGICCSPICKMRMNNLTNQDKINERQCCKCGSFYKPSRSIQKYCKACIVVELLCKQCGKRYTVQHNVEKKRKYCSKECARTARTEENNRMNISLRAIIPQNVSRMHILSENAYTLREISARYNVTMSEAHQTWKDGCFGDDFEWNYNERGVIVVPKSKVEEYYRR